MSTHKTQLEAGTYCKFDTPAECKKAFERAIKLGLVSKPTAYFLGDESVLLCHRFNGMVVANDGVPSGSTLIPPTEFLARMGGKWDVKH